MIFFATVVSDFSFLCSAFSAPSEVVGTISYINSYISEAGLHRRNTLPPIIFDLFSPPPAASSAAPDWPDWQGRCLGSGALAASSPKDWKGGAYEEEELDEGEEVSEETTMSHRRGKPVKRKRPMKIEHYPEFHPPASVTSKVQELFTCESYDNLFFIFAGHQR